MKTDKSAPIKKTETEHIDDYYDYKPGMKDDQGDKITEIVFQCCSIMVYFVKGTLDDTVRGKNKDEILRWRFHPDEDNKDAVKRNNEMHKLGAKAGVLCNRIYNSISSRWQQIKALHILAYELYAHFSTVIDSTEIITGRKCFFAETINYITTKSTESFQSHYVLSTGIITIIIVSIPALVYLFLYKDFNPQKDLVLSCCIGTIAGVVGAFTSIIQRLKTVEIQKYASLFFNWLRGFSRIFLGAIFGILIILIWRAGFISIDDNFYAIVILSFVAGFSERFVPELLEKIERRSWLEEIPNEEKADTDEEEPEMEG